MAVTVKASIDAVLLVAIALAMPLRAQQPLEDVLVTGTYAAVPAIDFTSTVSIIDADLIAALNKRNVADLLKTVPGLLVEQQGGPGGLTAVSVRGGEANFTLVLLDGVPVNEPTNSRGGSFDFASLDPASIERIEIVRGPQSSVYGSDALAGVINIISRRGGEQSAGAVRAEAGEDGFRNYEFNASGAAGPIRYAASLSHRDDGEPVEGSNRKTDIAQLLLDWEVLERHTLRLNLRYLDGNRSTYPEQSGGPLLATTDDLDSADYEDFTAVFDWQTSVVEGWDSELRFSWFDHQENFDSPGIAPYFEVPPYFSDTDFKRGFAHWINTLQAGEHTVLNVGADYRHEDGRSDGALVFGGFELPTDFSLERDTLGVFLEARTQLGDSLALQGSLRHDDPDDFSAETTWNLGARWQVAESLTARANWGEAFKIPSFFALGHGLVGNPGLQPETARSWDVGLDWVVTASLDVKATWFSNDYDDLIDFDPEQFINVNRNKVESRGVELELNWAPLQDLEFTAYGTHTDLNVKGEDSTLTGRPEWKAGAITRWQFTPQLLATLDYRWSDDQYSASRYTGETTVEKLDTIEQLDLNLLWRAAAGFTLELAVDNLLDENYETAIGFPAPGRLFRASVALGW